MKIAFVGNANNYPLTIARKMRALGKDVTFFLINDKNYKLDNPETRFPEYDSSYPEWIIDFRQIRLWEHKSLLSNEENYKYIKLISELVKFDCLILNHEAVFLSTYLQKPSFLILTGTDILTFAKKTFTDYKLLSQGIKQNDSSDLAVKLRDFINKRIDFQRIAIKESIGFCFFPKGVCRDADTILSELDIDSHKHLSFMITDTEELEYSSPPNNNPPRILFGSRLTWDKSKEPKFTELDYKGSDILIRAAGKLKNNGYNFELHLFRKGAHIEETEALAKSVGLESTIFWHDEVNQSEILEYYKQADIIVDNLESLGVGMVTVDSMAIGRPVIAKVENMKHFGILEHFPVCSAQTEEDVCNWLERLLIDSNLRESIGKNSRSFAEEYFSANKIAQIILSRLGDENVLKSGALGALIGGNMIDPQDRFGFGKNWNDFINNQFNKERVEVSKQNLLSSLKRDSLAGLAFLDIGCGSGLHSLAAILSGADRVVSFDYDPDSVKTAMMLRERYAADANWEILQGSALDTTFLESLGKFDIVYSWGVLHHTGHMWQAIENSAIPLADNGVHFIALYSHTVYQNGTLSGSPSPEKWLEIKQRYNKSSDFMKRIMEYKHVWNTFIKPPLFRPFQIFNNYKNFKECQREYIKSRGMEIWTDVRDWLGGWPMEFVNEFDLQRFMADKMGLRLVEMYCGEGNTEFVSVPHSAQNWWADIESRRSKFPLNGPFEKFGEFGWLVKASQLQELSDSAQKPKASPLRLYEDGKMLTLSHCPHDAISRLGSGRYSHWGDTIYFSATDNSNPNSNGRRYDVQH